MVTPAIDGFDDLETEPAPKAHIGIQWAGQQGEGYDHVILPLTVGGAVALSTELDNAIDAYAGVEPDDPLPGVIEGGTVIVDHDYYDATYVVDRVFVTEEGQTQVRLAQGSETTLVTIGDLIERFAADELSLGGKR